MRLANGFGSVVYLGKKRRKPYGARVTVGWTDEGKQKYKYINFSNISYKHVMDKVIHNLWITLSSLLLNSPCQWVSASEPARLRKGPSASA